MALSLIRRSFRARLLTAFMATLGALLLVLYQAVRSETAQQIDAVASDAVARSEAVWQRAEAFRRTQLERATAPFTEGIRAAVALEELFASGDLEGLHPIIEYELERNGLDLERYALAFTDPQGTALFTLVGGVPMYDGDALDIEPLAREVLLGSRDRVQAYRVVGDELLSVQVTPVFLGPEPVGAVAQGFPIDDSAADEIGRVVGVEVCFVVGEHCMAGTPMARNELLATVQTFAPSDTPHQVENAGARWDVMSSPLDPGQPEDGWRVVAVPLDPVLGPFERVQRTLLLAGLGVLIAAGLVSSILARSLARPVRALVAGTERVAQGDFTAEVDVERDDELGTLASSFNEMTRGLLLKERYRGILDKVVSREVADELTKGDVALGGETRRATVLFADIRGFTPLTEGMEPQAVIGLLNECMQILSDAVDAEGGVVDKYVGDELMAVWGAPVARPDDAARAVRAAVRMRDGIEAWNQRRRAGGEAPLGVGIGINTGQVVAGNMGSTNRLNYTVLGEEVNLANRLCSAAGAGEILVSGVTDRLAGSVAATEAAGERTLKGFERTVEVFRVRGASLALALLLWATPLWAQTTPALSWMSGGGTYQVDVSGRLDLEAYVPQDEPAYMIPATDPFLAPRLRIFADLFAGDRLYGLVEIRADRGEEPSDGDLHARVEQAFLRWTPGPPTFQIQAGRFASPFGSYPRRHHTVADPFIRPPLLYDYRTMICPTLNPGTAQGFVDWKETPELFRPKGAPVVWGAPYQWGALAMAAVGPLDLSAAWMNSAPSSDPYEWDLDTGRLDAGSVVLAAGLQVNRELRVRLSYNLGSYLVEHPDGAPFPEGAESADYDQELVGLEAVWSRGPQVVRGELIFDRWEVPNVAYDPRDVSWYLEVQRDLMPGLFAAARVGGVDFRPMDVDETYSDDWDYDIWRWQVAAGYRIVRNAEVRLEYMANRAEGPADPRDDLLSAQLWLAF